MICSTAKQVNMKKMQTHTKVSTAIKFQVILLIMLHVPPATAQPPQHFAKQLLNLEQELEEFRDKIDQKEREIRAALSKRTNELYTLREKQRDADILSDEEKKNLQNKSQHLLQALKKTSFV